MAGLTLTAPAKLNLHLRVGPRGPDGYHPLRSLMIALDAPTDTVEARLAPTRRLRCPGAPEGPQNLAWRALDALEAEVGRPLPLALAITKRIPAEAGLGGGSSDAAAALVAADRLHGLGLGVVRLEAVGARVGADVPFFVRGGAQWAEGRGERLTPTRAPALAAVLALPAARLATPAVYAAFDRLASPLGRLADGPPASRPTRGAALGDLPQPPLAHWARNDLWPAAFALAPELGRLARALRAAGAGAVLLCGSGAALAGLTPGVASARAVAARLDPRAGTPLAVAVPAPPRADAKPPRSGGPAPPPP